MKDVRKAIMFSSFVILLLAASVNTEADILSDKPYYIKTDVIVSFHTESKATLLLNYSWYGMMANDVESMLARYPGGEENYTKGFIEYVKREVQGPYLAGDFEFYPTEMEAKIEREREGNYTKRVSLVLTAELDAKRGAPRLSEGRTGLIYSTREDMCNLSKIYMKEVDLMNVTVILPRGYVLSRVRPTPNSIYTINSTDGIRVAISWVIRNPVVDTRGSAGYSGWFYIGAVNLTKDEVDKLNSLRNAVADLRKQFVMIDESGGVKAMELFDLFYVLSTRAPYTVSKNLSYALALANELPRLPISPDTIVLIASALAVACEVVLYFIYVKRK